MSTVAAMSTIRRSRMRAGNWTDLFPNELDTLQGSTKFARKLVAIGISQIMYLRAGYSERAFFDADLDGFKLKMLRGSGPECRELCDLINSALDGVKMRYLKELTLAFFLGEEPEDAFETYTFSFAYGEFNMTTSVGVEKGGGGGDANSKKSYKEILKESSRVGEERVYDMTVKFLRKIILTTQNLSNLPTENVFATVMLAWNKDTPPEYEPAGFSPADYTFKLHDTCQGVKAGCGVVTKHNAVSARIRSVELMETISSQETKTRSQDGCSEWPMTERSEGSKGHKKVALKETAKTKTVDEESPEIDTPDILSGEESPIEPTTKKRKVCATTALSI